MSPNLLSPDLTPAELDESDVAATLACALLQGLPQASLIATLRRCKKTNLFEGARLLTHGQDNASLYLVLAGSLHVHLTDTSDLHHFTVGPGQCVGEMSIIDGRSASALVLAAEDSLLIVMPHEEVWILVDHVQGFARNLLHMMASRVRNDNRLIIESLHSRRELEQAAYNDALTGLRNRRAMERAFPVRLAQTLGSNEPACLLMIDIDHFKRLNDTHGHVAGDAVLREVGRTLIGCLRASELVARYGGEEFAILLPNLDIVGAVAVAERIRAAVEQHAVIAQPGGSRLQVTVSVGVAPAAKGEPLQGLVARADLALYLAKEQGRNRVIAAD